MGDQTPREDARMVGGQEGGSVRKIMSFLSIVANCRSEHYPTTGLPTPPEYIVDGDLISIKQAGALVAGKRGLVLVHGYRSEVGPISAAYNQVEDSLESFGMHEHYDFTVRFLWPGGTSVLSWPFSDHLRADLAGMYLSQVRQHLWAATLDVQAHSLGARLALGMTSAIRFMLLVGAAVPVSMGASLDCLPTMRRIVYYSRNDKVLKYGFRLGSWGRPALGCVGPVGLDGRYTGVDLSSEVLQHSGYRHSKSMYQHWKGLLENAS